MKPYKILAFMLLMLVLTAAVAYVFPPNGVALGHTIQLKFNLTYKQLFQDTIEYADITAIIVDNEAIIIDDTIATAELQTADTLKADANRLRAKVQAIEYPAGDTTVLHSFFHKLNSSNTALVRILHYGDSQIEGDRISGYLRNNFQQRFGGSGPGLLPAVSGSAESSSIIHLASDNWQTYSVYSKIDTALYHRQFGVLGCFARFNNSTKKSEPKTASIEFNRSGMAFNSVNNFTQCKVFYGQCYKPLIVKGLVNDSLIWFEEIDTTYQTSQIQWNFTTSPKKFKIEFESVDSPNIYAIALDNAVGVALDNIPFRGSSGTEFTRIDFQQMNEMGSYVNAGLIIMEFGVNVVPNQVKNYDYYEKLFTRQLNYLKSVYSGCAILVIGVSDISQRNENGYQSYPNIELVSTAQRNAAKNTNCAFWNLYNAMGGKNSMPSWVFANPPLAAKDFTHFNRKGGHIVAQMIYNALMQDYESYQVRQKALTLNNR